MLAKLEGREIKNIIKDVLENFKKVILVVMPSMTEANTPMILKTIKDTTCLALCPQTDEVEGLLKEFMPKEDIPAGLQVLGAVEDIKPLSHDQKDMLVGLFDILEMAHKRMVRVCGPMLSLAGLKPKTTNVSHESNDPAHYPTQHNHKVLGPPSMSHHKIEVPQD